MADASGPPLSHQPDSNGATAGRPVSPPACPQAEKSGQHGCVATTNCYNHVLSPTAITTCYRQHHAPLKS